MNKLLNYTILLTLFTRVNAALSYVYVGTWSMRPKDRKDRTTDHPDPQHDTA